MAESNPEEFVKIKMLKIEFINQFESLSKSFHIEGGIKLSFGGDKNSNLEIFHRCEVNEPSMLAYLRILCFSEVALKTLRGLHIQRVVLINERKKVFESLTLSEIEETIKR